MGDDSCVISCCAPNVAEVVEALLKVLCCDMTEPAVKVCTRRA